MVRGRSRCAMWWCRCGDRQGSGARPAAVPANPPGPVPRPPTGSVASLSAPAASSSRTTSTWPLVAAACRAVTPSCSNTQNAVTKIAKYDDVLQRQGLCTRMSRIHHAPALSVGGVLCVPSLIRAQAWPPELSAAARAAWRPLSRWPHAARLLLGERCAWAWGAPPPAGKACTSANVACRTICNMKIL